MKGRLEPDYYITCGRCEYGHHVGENRYALAVEVARLAGWSHTRKDGWICPDCRRAGSVRAAVAGAGEGRPE